MTAQVSEAVATAVVVGHLRPIVATTLRCLVELEDDLQVVATAEDLAVVLRVLPGLGTGVLVLDLALLGGGTLARLPSV